MKLDRKEFLRRFVKCQTAYVECLRRLCGTKITCSNYICDTRLSEDGSIVEVLLKDEVQNNSSDIEAVLRYIEFLTGQGFSVEVAIEWSESICDIHIASWEESFDFEWPPELNIAYSLRWHPVAGPENLGMQSDVRA